MSSDPLAGRVSAPIGGRFLVPILVGIPLILTLAVMWGSGFLSSLMQPGEAPVSCTTEMRVTWVCVSTVDDLQVTKAQGCRVLDGPVERRYKLGDKVCVVDNRSGIAWLETNHGVWVFHPM